MSTMTAASLARRSPAAERFLHDLEELVEYYRDRGLDGEAIPLTEAHFLSALARYRLGGSPAGILAERRQVVVFGGAGAGKSTVANMLIGSGECDVNAQAGYTRRPTLYFQGDDATADPKLPIALGLLAREDGFRRGDGDADTYGWRRLGGDAPDVDFLSRHAVWDCPDLTTKDARHYQPRMVEIAGLADVAVYVASDERYNDERPTNFLQGLLDAGITVVVVMTKMDSSDASSFVRLFRDSVLSRLRRAEQVAEVLAIPSPPSGNPRDLWSVGSESARSLRDVVARTGHDLASDRLIAAQRAVAHLREKQSRLLEPLRKDLAEWKGWLELVRQQANAAVHRYERDYLIAVEHRPFQDAVQSLRRMMGLPGAGNHLWQVLEALRWPFRSLKGLWRRFGMTRRTASIDEDKVLDRVRRQMLESLRLAVSTRRSRHVFWENLRASLDSEAAALIDPRYQRERRRLRSEVDEYLMKATSGITEQLERNALAVWSLRGSRLALDVLVIAAATYVSYEYLGGVSLVMVLAVLLSVGAAEELVDGLCGWFVHRHQDGVVQRQKENIRELLRLAYIDPLLTLPVRKGTRLARLNDLAERLPRDLAALMEDRRPEASARARPGASP